MSVYLFVTFVFSILLPYSTWAVGTWVILHVTFYFACQRATLYIIQGHQHWRTWCRYKFLQRFRTALTNPIESNLLLTKLWPSGHDSANCTWIMHIHTRRAILNSVLWHILVFFFLKIPAPKSKSCGKWDDHLGEREWSKLMYCDCRWRLQHKGSFGACKMQRKIVQVACCFSHRDIQCGK